MKQLEGVWMEVVARTQVRISCPGGPAAFGPGQIFNSAAINTRKSVSLVGPMAGVVEAIDLKKAVRQAKVLSIVRPGELGDVLVALTACRMIKRAMPDLQVQLMTHTRFHPAIQGQHEVSIHPHSIGKRSTSERLVVDFTGYFEVDHEPGAAHVPRLCRVLWPLGFGVPGWPAPE